MSMAGKRLRLEDLPLTHRRKIEQKLNAAKPKRVRVPTGQSKAEALFLFHVEQFALPLPVREFRFSEMTGRGWRFDFAWPALKLAVEIEGLTHATVDANGQKRLGRHQTINGYTEDCEKYNQATFEGWRVFHFTPKHVRSLHAVTMIQTVFEGVKS